ncbi:DUF1707 SHOCT-like domain-containing protein [Spirochaeta dissipatitropha]
MQEQDSKEMKIQSRASDSDRMQVEELLRSAATDGRIDFSELEDRLTAVYEARTMNELALITADLPADAVPELKPLVMKNSSGVMKKNGVWQVPSEITTECNSGTITIDFNKAVCRHTSLTVRATVNSGIVKLIVPEGWNVNMDDVSINSGISRNKATAAWQPGKPVITVQGTVNSGVLKAVHPGPGPFIRFLQKLFAKK